MNRPLLAAALAVAVAVPAGLALGQAQVIQQRQDVMKSMNESLQTIQRIVQAGGPTAEAVAPARVVAEQAPKIKTLFPPGTEQGGNTRAQPTVWSDRSGFEQRADAFAAQAPVLLAAAQGSDVAALGRALQATGDACLACHRPHRAPRR